MRRMMIGTGLLVSLLLTVSGCADEGEVVETVNSAEPGDEGPPQIIDGQDESEVDNPTARTAAGGWIGIPVAVKVKVVGESTWVSEIYSYEKYTGGGLNGATGHTEIYRKSQGKVYSIYNTAQHHITSSNGGTTSVSMNYGKNLLDGDKICARFWIYQDGAWQNDGSSCVNISD
jgi:hypothetical protein